MDKKTLFLLLLLLLAALLVRKFFFSVIIPDMEPGKVAFSADIAVGVTVDAASKERGKELDIDIARAQKEIDAASALGAGLVRFNLEKKTLASAEESAKLDQVISYARARKMRIFLALMGRESDLGSPLFPAPGGGTGKARWEDFQREYKWDAAAVAGRYKPEYVLILPECPEGIGAQIDSERTVQEWVNFAKEVGLAVKQANFSTRVALEGTLAGASSQSDFAEMVLEDNDVALDIFSLNAKSADELEAGVENLLALRDKYHWNGQLWLGDVAPLSGDEPGAQEDFLLYAFHLANSHDLSGIILSRLCDSGQEKSGLLGADFSPKPSYGAVREVLARKK
jgi:hypothetical protein